MDYYLFGFYLLVKPNKDHQAVLAEQPDRTNHRPTKTIIKEQGQN